MELQLSDIQFFLIIMKFSLFFHIAALALPRLISAQLTGKVGALVPATTKEASKICNVLEYGGIASTSHDIGPALTEAWAACATNGMGWYLPDSGKLS